MAWPGTASHELLEIFSQAASLFFFFSGFLGREKDSYKRIWEPIRNSKGVNTGPVEVEFSSSNSSGMSYTCVVSGWGGTPCFRSLK